VIRKRWFIPVLVFSAFLLWTCARKPAAVDSDEKRAMLDEFEETTGLEGEWISYEPIIRGDSFPEFKSFAGAEYKPGYNEDPAIPVQCWIETGYGTQNACKYCHTNYLADIQHGNAFPLAEDQILFSFPSPNLNRINWKNVTHPHEIIQRLEKDQIPLPEAGHPENLKYVRQDNWTAAFQKARPNGDDSWNNLSNGTSAYQLMPALDPGDLYPWREKDPTGGGVHGYMDREGFVRNRADEYTGWRAVNFFPYAIFTPLTGSVSGIYIRLPRPFRTRDGKLDMTVYGHNLDLLAKNIKDESPDAAFYAGDASHVPVKKGFYPVGTEFAHPLHYVDLYADGEMGFKLNGLDENKKADYEFPGTRSKRVKEIRYMYKWKDVGLEDIGEEDEEPESGEEAEIPAVMGKEWKGWIDNGAGWILSAFIENREGALRPQTTEEILQCKGCHSSVGNTVDAVWSFQRKLPDDLGWREMDYGCYRQDKPDETKLQDYYKVHADMGEQEHFYYTVVGADLFGIMPGEIKSELKDYANRNRLDRKLDLKNPLEDIFNDAKLKMVPKDQRKALLLERAAIMRHYAASRAYLYHDPETDRDYIKGNIYYPSKETMEANIAGYRRIVLDQSFNLGKNVFGTQPEAIPFTFRSDGTVRNGMGELIPLGQVIDSRPWGEDGIGITPTGIVAVNEQGEPVDENGRVVDIEVNPEDAEGHLSRGGTFETRYNPIVSDKAVQKK